MIVTKQAVAEKIAAYLHHRICSAGLVFPPASKSWPPEGGPAVEGGGAPALEIAAHDYQM